MQDTRYAQLSRKTLRDAGALLGEGDYHQASGKFWGAAAIMVKAVAEVRDWSHGSHRQLYQVISRLAREDGHRELVLLFGSAGQLHMNFYEEWLPPDQVEEMAAQVRLLLGGLERILNQYQGENYIDYLCINVDPTLALV